VEAETRRHNLPSALTSFVGREAEVVAASRLLDTSRLVTLVGSGGIGKTRLALRMVGDLVDSYADGIWLVELAPLTDPLLLPWAVAAALGVHEQPGRPMQASLADHVEAWHALLLLDNCEHVVQAAAELCDGLLRACPWLRVLATSRQALGVDGEAVFPVAPLSLPQPEMTPEQVPRTEAIRLFVDRAAAAVPSFRSSAPNYAVIGDICRQLDGVPLAIELAATRLKLLGAEQLAARLEDRLHLLTAGSRTSPNRHQTLRATIDWSYRLLSEPERILLRRLAVFSGGWTLTAAEEVAGGDDIRRADVLGLLEQLLDKSLVVVENHVHDQVRFRFLESIRQYAQERLDEAGEMLPSRQRHLAWCLRLARDVQPPGMHHPWHAEESMHEQDNLRAALTWAIQEANAEAGLRLAVVLAHIWYMRGHYSEGRARLSALLDLPSSTIVPEVRASALTWAGHLAYCQGDLAIAQALLERSLIVWQELGNAERTAASLHLLGNVVRFRGAGALEEARPLFEQASIINRRLGHRMREAMNKALVAQVLFEQGDFERAEALNEQSLVALQAAGPGWGTVLTLCMAGRVAATRGDHTTARSRLEESVELGRSLRISRGVVWSLYFLAQHALAQGNAKRARATFAESLRLALQTGDRLATAHGLEGFAGALAMTQPGRAVRLAEAAAMLRQALGSTPFPADRDRLDRWLTVAAGRLGENATDAARNEGRQMTIDQALEYALSADEPTMSEDASQMLTAIPFHGLTRREMEILRLVALARSNREIAAGLVLSEKTVERHLSHIFTKLQVSSRTAAARLAVQAGIA
jgi:predicted ATPase/DNA-binding CsgD family transcriptional regulator